MPWLADKAPALDIAYHSRSGSKFVAPIAYNFLNDEGEMTNEGYTKINSAIRALYLQKWYHLWDLYSASYQPLDNYKVTETRHEENSDSKTLSSTRTPNLVERKTGDDDTSTSVTESSSLQHGLRVTDGGTDSTSVINGHVITDGGTDTTTATYGKVTTSEGEPTSTTTNKVMAFDGQDFSNVSETDEASVTDNVETLSGSDSTALLHGKTETHSGTDQSSTQYGKTQTNSGTDTQSGTKSDTTSRDIDITTSQTGTETNAGTESGSFESDFELTKSGTVFKSPAELMSADRDFWQEQYFDIVFADIDNFLTLAIFSDKEINHKIY